jgi:hypothetical protein
MYATLDEAIAAYPRDRKPEDGQTTCLWHRQHEFYLANIVPLLPRCPICGGVGDPRQPRHELCRLRARDGRPTPELNTVSKCPCAKCSPSLGRRG